MLKKILIVDDHPLNLIGLSRALKVLCNFQGEIKTVENGREAIEEFGLHFYNICFLDINLPDMDGIDVMKKIHDTSPETDVVIISGHMIYDDMRKIIEEKASLYISKPYDILEISEFLKQVMEGDGNFYMKHPESSGVELKKGKRRSKRKELNKTINFITHCADSKKCMGDIIDISYSGVGLQLHFPLEQGSVINFNGGISHKKGIVRWSIRLDDYNHRAGIGFLL